MRVVVSGGGTGGHFFPALAVLKGARKRKIETLYVGSTKGIEKKFENLIPGDKVLLNSQPFRGESLFGKISSLISLFSSSFKIKNFLRDGDRVLIFGGYASAPLGLASFTKGLNIFVHEQNSVPGTVNRLLGSKAKKIFITFEYTRRFFEGKEVIRSGTPLREEIRTTKVDRREAKEAMGFDKDSLVFLFMGGSQGARFINSLAVDFVKKTGSKVIVLTGEKDFERTNKLLEDYENARVYPFRTDMGLVYSAVDIAVCRSGSSTVSELAFFGIPSVFIPYPYAVGDHQYYNAKEIEDLGGGFVLRQDDTTVEKVIGLVDRIVGNYESMSKAIRNFYVEGSEEIILNHLLEDS